MLTDPPEVQEHAVTFYTKAIQHLHKGLPRLSTSEAKKELSLAELSAAIEGLTMGKAESL